jgi:hypothetical protein
VPNPDLTVEQRRALQTLADAPNGRTEQELRKRGFSPTLIVGLLGAGYISAKALHDAGSRLDIRNGAVRDHRVGQTCDRLRAPSSGTANTTLPTDASEQKIWVDVKFVTRESDLNRLNSANRCAIAAK